MFTSNEVSLLSRIIKELKVTKLKPNDYLVAAFTLKHSDADFAIFDGAYKRINLNELKLSKRTQAPSLARLQNKKQKPILAASVR